jgi:RNA polymerase sigma factor (sigma-70 family)
MLMDSYAGLDDHELISMLGNGDESAFNVIFKRHWKTLYDEAFKRLRNEMQSEEIVQDVFAQLWIRRDTQKIENLLPYLRTAVKYQVFSLYKKVKQLPAFEEPLEHMAIATLQADSQFFAKELRRYIDAWLEMQPEKRREIFRLRYLEDYSTKEISEKLNISQKTVQNTLATAILSLKQSLGAGLTGSIILMAYFDKHF